MRRLWLMAAVAGGLVGGLAATAWGQESAGGGASGTVEFTPEMLIRYGSKEIPARTEGSIRVMNWNIENLFDDADDPAISGRIDDKFMTKDPAHLAAAADLIRRADPDIIALQEIESKAALEWFRDGWLKDLGYQYISSLDAGDERGIEQAVLSRFPIVAEKNWAGQKLDGVAPAGTREAGRTVEMHRSPLLATVEVPAEKAGGTARRITFLVVHQKSGRDWAWLREMESATFVRLIKEAMAAAENGELVFAGDFNALPTDASFRAYESTGLVDVLAGRGEGAEWVTHASGRIIDHIMVSPGLAERVVDGSARVIGTPILPEGIDYRTAPSPPGYISDHFPLVVDVRLGEP